MQGCFRKYPDVYGSELESDAEEDDDDLTADAASATVAVDAGHSDSESAAQPLKASTSAKQSDSGLVPKEYRPNNETDRAKKATEQVKQDHEPASESEQLVPKAAHDASDVKVEKK